MAQPPDQHLSYPSVPIDSVDESSSSTQQPREVLRDRLYIGNLHPTVDELVSRFPQMDFTLTYHQVHPPPSIFKVWKSHEARLSVPQIWFAQRQTSRLRFHRVCKQRRTSLYFLSVMLSAHPGFTILFTYTAACIFNTKVTRGRAVHIPYHNLLALCSLRCV